MSDDIKTVDNGTTMATDMPKLEAPFKREENEDGEYVVIDEVNPGYEWVFEDDDVMAVEKLHGTNVSVVVRAGQIVAVFNRDNRIPAFNENYQYITKGILNSMSRGYCGLQDGQWFGELVGPKVNGNPYDLDEHLWIPFHSYAQRVLEYESWGDYPQTFDAISDWFNGNLIPLFYSNIHGVDFDTAMEDGFVEGVVFTHPDGRMAKLRKDMFEWWDGPRH